MMMQNLAPVSTPTTNSRWAQLIARMPRPDKEEKILKEVEEGQVEKIVTDLLAGGREAVVALVDLLHEPVGDANDSPVRHALHALAIHVGSLDTEQRRATAAALASTLSGRERSAGIRAFVVRQLQLCGGREVTPILGKLLADEQLYTDAAMALLAIRDGAVEQFRSALPDLAGPPRVAVIQALGTLRDVGSAEPLRRAAERDPDPVARLEAAWALANIGDPGSVEVILRLAGDCKGFDRTRATKACLLLAEKLGASGHDERATRIYRHLRDMLTDPSERYIRDVAVKAIGS